jgi:hypothetical protein
VRVASGDLFAVTRSTGKNEYVIAANSGDSPADITIPVTSQGTQWQPLSGDGTLTSSTSGSITLHLPGQGLFVAQATDFTAPQSTATLKINPVTTDLNTQGWMPVTATIAGNGYNQVDFMVRTSGGTWQDLGTADRRTFAVNQTKGGLYRVYLHPSLYKKGTKLEIQAIARDSAGNQSQSVIIKYTVGS